MHCRLDCTIKTKLEFCVPQISDRIIGGQWANEDQFPYQIAIVSRSPQSGRVTICSGSSPVSNWVLTSATCVLTSTNYELRSGSVNFYTGGNTVTSNEGIVHPLYDAFTQDNNFGLIRAIGLGAKILPLVHVKDNIVLPGRQSTIAGWGLTTTNEISPVLQYAQGSIKKPGDPICRYNFNNVTNESSRLCATFRGQRSCAGDTGSPLVIQVNRAVFSVGVASFSPLATECENSTSLFTGFSALTREWIKNTTGTAVP